MTDRGLAKTYHGPGHGPGEIPDASPDTGTNYCSGGHPPCLRRSEAPASRRQADPSGRPAEADAAASVVHPVFRGLELAGLAGKEIAELCEVSPPTVSKWRKGRARVPMGRVVFLTMLLAHLADELASTYAGWGPAPQDWHRHMQARLEGARRALAEQDAINAAFPAGAMRQGTRLFREWWHQDGRPAEAADAARRVALGRDPAGLLL